ncbi:MAG: HAMP domain-containing histidine kinase [Campylobacteraceae bacterium]|nr:HAMP domain-containing histidine kinase [Campylobacteraceae bacterium]
MQINKLFNFYEKIPFSYKTSFLIFVIAGGMFTIILLSQISMYALKNDFDFLFEKRTKPIIKLEIIKDTFAINIYDTLYDVQHKNITIAQSRDVIVLGQQLINKNWLSYKKTSLIKSEDSFFITELIKKLALNTRATHNEKLQHNIIKNIDRKIVLINQKINTIYILFSQKNKDEAILLIDKINFDINSINIYLTNLTNYDLNLAIDEKIQTQEVFNILSNILNISIFLVFLFCILLSIIIINNFRISHYILEAAIEDKTKELLKLNDTLANKVKTEVLNSRKKDIIMFQQAKLASLGEMISNIAHQWRQPLSSILMIVQSFQVKMSLGKLTQEYMDEKVNDAILLSQNMSNTLEDFQNYFKPNKEKSLFQISDCINHSLSLAKYILDQEKIVVSLIIKEELSTYGFYNELSHVLLNMISNSKDALKNKSNNKLIKIVLKCQNNFIVIKIYDNGGGIKQEALPHIFDPYYTTKYKSAGTGIGLYMSKQIIEKHMNGNIKCKNVYYNINKTIFEDCALFIIAIPIVKAKDE